MRNKIPIVIAAFSVFLVSMAVVFIYDFHGKNSLSPVTNKGEKWRIGYYEGGPWIDYRGNLVGIVEGLAELGWVEKTALPESRGEADTRELWRWLGENCRSSYIRFVADAYWSSNWDDDLRRKNKEKALDRLARGNDLDLIVAAGTWAGQDLATDLHSVPAVVISASNPVQSGIVRGVEHSGFDHVLAKVDPERHVRQMKLFHNLVHFQRLGLVYEDTPEGRTYAALNDVRRVAEEEGFEVVACKTDFANLDVRKAEEGVLQCIEDLAPRIDAFYVTDHRGQTVESVPGILGPLLRRKVPTWAQSGSEFVRKGVLFSTTKVEYKEYGLFYAENIARIFRGEKPGDLNQIFEDPKSLAINLETAKKIGFEVPSSLREHANEVYENIDH